MRPAQELKELAWKLRKEVLQVLVGAGSGHTASSLGLAEFVAVMYGGVLRYIPDKPRWEGRDRLVVSNGHVAPIWYVTLAEFGFFPREELMSLRRLGSRLQGHPHTIYSEGKEDLLPGIENTSGPLSQGVSVAVGISLGLRLKRDKLMWQVGHIPKVYCLMSDAELQEGQTWEAFELAVKQRVNNLVLIIDRNNIQIDTYVDKVMEIEPLEAKLEAFGFEVREIDGNKVEDLLMVFHDGRLGRERPSVVIMKTVAGKGVSFMENKWEWHGKVPSKEELERAIKEIDKKLKAQNY